MRSGSAVLVVLALLAAAPLCAQQGSPAGPVPQNLLEQRRARLLDRIGNGVVIMQARRDADEAQDKNFFYLTGIETPGAWLLLVTRTNGAAEVVLYMPARNSANEQWTGGGIDAQEAGRITGIADVRPVDRVAAEIGALLKPGTTAYVNLPKLAYELCQERETAACIGLFLRPLRVSQIEVRDVGSHIAEQRLIKDEDEQRRLRRAIDITAGALRTAMQIAKPGIWEYELHAAIEHGFRANGAQGPGFPTIVGSGPNATILHYRESRRQTRAGELVVMDVGADFGYYTADVTRTIPVSGKFTPRQRALYDLVLGSQQAAMDSVKPGITLMRLDQIARNHMRRNSGNLCAPQTCDTHFVHMAGHWLGMDVHDPAVMSTPLTAGMVLTVEPGIYIAKEAIGIRIEDDVLVTATGYELLSGAAPRKAEDIEKLMAGGS